MNSTSGIKCHVIRRCHAILPGLTQAKTIDHCGYNVIISVDTRSVYKHSTRHDKSIVFRLYMACYEALQELVRASPVLHVAARCSSLGAGVSGGGASGVQKPHVRSQ